MTILREEFSSRFTGFRCLKSDMTIFSFPFTGVIGSAPVELQFESNSIKEYDILP